jgi:choline dehydrogenase-like flavoprotein
MTERYDLAIVGTSFAGAFFLMRYLEHAPANARVVVLERGAADPKAWQVAHRRTSSIAPEQVFVNRNKDKAWLVSPGFGGNSKCWWGGTTRMMPGDFQLRTRYGVGDDWPMTYEDLAPHYDVVEEVMKISGPAGLESPMPRAKPFPLPPHRFADTDEALKRKFPDGWFHGPTARASAPTNTRGVCCATGYCEMCPVDAKFTIQNGLAHIYKDPRVTLLLESTVDQVDTAGRVATGLTYTSAGRQSRVAAELVVLGANAIFNPHILLRSGFQHRLLGKRLHEQLGIGVCLDLGGVKGYNGSTHITGNGYMFYEGEHRREYAACMIENWNTPFVDGHAALRADRGRWNERMFMRFMFDDLPREDNTVTVHAADARLAETHFSGYSEYAERGAALIPKMVDELANALPIERIEFIDRGATSAHIQGTVVMGHDPASSIVDKHLIHHTYRNLLVLGCSAYPTASPAYPSLTVSALSLWAADHLLASRAA